MTPNLPAGGQPPQHAPAIRAPRARAVTPTARHQPGRRHPASTAPAPGSPRRSRAPDARVPRLRVRIGSPASLLAVIPGLLGFEPGHSIVVIGIEPPDGRGPGHAPL